MLEQCENNKVRYFVADFGGHVRTVICKLSWGKRCSSEHHWRIVSGQMGKELKEVGFFCLRKLLHVKSA